MWGISSLILVAAFGAVVLVIALIAGWGLPLLAVAIVVLIAPLVAFSMSRESGEPGGDDPEDVGGKRGGKPSWMRKHWYE